MYKRFLCGQKAISCVMHDMIGGFRVCVVVGMIMREHGCGGNMDGWCAQGIVVVVGRVVFHECHGRHWHRLRHRLQPQRIRAGWWPVIRRRKRQCRQWAWRRLLWRANNTVSIIVQSLDLVNLVGKKGGGRKPIVALILFIYHASFHRRIGHMDI
ncbi:hypothetical protein BC940DRAFT_307530, partial [Gongronella butleri]